MLIEKSGPLSQVDWLAKKLEISDLPRLKSRALDVHKGDLGHVLVIGGNRNMPGAPILAAHAAMRSGAGLVSLCPGFSSREGSLWPEIITLLPQSASYNCHGKKSLQLVKEHLSLYRPTILLGPGLGTSDELIEFTGSIMNFAQAHGLFGVIDADGLNCISDMRLSFDFSGFVLTPHPGEAARLLKCSVSEIQQDRPGAAARISNDFPGAVVALKGAGTVIYRDGVAFINPTGNPFLATAGSGDILAGLIAGLIAQDATPMEAALLGVYTHGAIGDSLIKRRYGPIVASDLLGEIPYQLGLFIDR